MALKFSFIKIRQPKRFEYVPRIWDPDKEDRENRLKRIREELGTVNETSSGKPYVPNIKGSFKKEYERNKNIKPRQAYRFKTRSFLTVITVGLLLVIFFYFAKLFPYLFTQEQNTPERIEIYE
ncbi:MAG: hypothetical protein LBR10_12405 [Prevotellaceae bacterium]|jgi:hypothetical protein|nr:hypothetical protein [Prevotellaceae bacterium]